MLEGFFTSYTERPGDYWTSTVGVIVFLFGLLLIVFQIQDLIRYSVKCEATLESSEPTYKTKRGREHAYHNTYVYQIDRRKYRITVREDSSHEAGYARIISCDRKDPSKARAGVSGKLILLGLPVMAAGIYIFVRGLSIAAA